MKIGPFLIVILLWQNLFVTECDQSVKIWLRNAGSKFVQIKNIMANQIFVGFLFLETIHWLSSA